MYKMTNTADSMIGYRNARHLAFGWAAARLDDVLNYVPARLTAALICTVSVTAPGGSIRALRTMFRDARSHQSPNAGWPEAAIAGGLDVWLGGPRHYGNRVQPAQHFNVNGKSADKNTIQMALGILKKAQIFFGLGLVLLALSLAPETLTQ